MIRPSGVAIGNHPATAGAMEFPWIEPSPAWNGNCGKVHEPEPHAMNPIDPAKRVSDKDESPMAPPYVDEDPNLASVEDGLDAAEDELRDTVADAYEASAKESEDPEEALDDIDYEEEDATTRSPEVAAMEEKEAPEGDSSPL